MKSTPCIAKCSTLAALAAVIFFSSLTGYGQSIRPAADGQFNLLVLGDSILWGQGLRDEHKSWYLVKTWLESNGRHVRERVEAHSGAVIGAAGDSGADPVPAPSKDHRNSRRPSSETARWPAPRLPRPWISRPVPARR